MEVPSTDARAADEQFSLVARELQDVVLASAHKVEGRLRYWHSNRDNLTDDMAIV